MSASASADKVVCECCELCVPKQLASAIRNPYGLVRGWRCRICNEHQGQPVKMAQDHEEEVRIRWGETVDELHAALDRAGPRPGTWCTTKAPAHSFFCSAGPVVCECCELCVPKQLASAIRNPYGLVRGCAVASVTSTKASRSRWRKTTKRRSASVGARRWTNSTLRWTAPGQGQGRGVRVKVPRVILRVAV